MDQLICTSLSHTYNYWHEVGMLNVPAIMVYMDDVIACSATLEAHLRLLADNVFRALQAAGLTLKPSRTHFGPKGV